MAADSEVYVVRSLGSSARGDVTQPGRRQSYGVAVSRFANSTPMHDSEPRALAPRLIMAIVLRLRQARQKQGPAGRDQEVDHAGWSRRRPYLACWRSDTEVSGRLVHISYTPEPLPGMVSFS